VIVGDCIRFGLFELDPATGDLRREGRPVRLQPQPARVLALLVSRAGEVVSREELRQQIWNDGTFVDFERGLNFCISQIRTALNDSADSPRFIETLPKRGYRFIAPVTATPAGPERAQRVEGAETSAASATRGVSRWGVAAGGLAVVAVVLIALLAASGRDSRIRVAVVPFDNETGDSSYGNLGQGIADATVARLAATGRVERLAVVGNSAALRQPRSFRDLKAIGEAADVEYVVLAQVKRDPSKVRLIAHLIRVSDEAHVWAQTFDRDAFTLEAQADIAEQIAKSVADRLAH
jgi:DNA-binding winged helix-turn-helix (wHTH) protein/TolB-like protein